MSKVDWILAPNDAQIYSPEFGDCNAVWYKVHGGKVFCWPIGSHGWSERHTMIGELIYRPKQEPKPWSGPEDGLPPVGTKCQVIEGPALWVKDLEWLGKEVTVHSVFKNGLGQDLVSVGRNEGQCTCFIVECLSPISTPEQRAAEQRETAIREFMDIVGIDCRVTAGKAVDAGFKR